MPPRPPVRSANTKLHIRKLLTNFLVFMGAVFLLLIFIWAAALGYGAYIRNVLTPSSKEYVDKSILAITPTWSQDELIKRASWQMREVTSKGQLDQIFADCARLGAFKHYDGANGEVEVSVSEKDGQLITAPYIAKVSFQNGTAEIEIKLIRNNNSWEILGFHVHLNLFLPYALPPK